jgi:hypothetical protein
MRVEIRHDTGTDLTVSMALQLGADTDGDGVVDTWGPLDNNGNGIIEANQDDIGLDWSLANGCRLEVNANGDNDFNDADERFSVQGNAVSEDWCDQGHLMQAISPFALEVEDLSFLPAPAFDPYLAFRNDEAQVQPNVFINLNLSLRNPDRYGFEVVETPTLNFQTTVSSRVFGNIRR